MMAGVSYALTEPPRRCQCRSYNTTPGYLTDTPDFYHREWLCHDCGNRWLVGDLKYHPYYIIQFKTRRLH